MIIEIRVPNLGESINEVEIGEWFVKIGDKVQPADPIVAIESEKATIELPAPQGGILVEIVKQQGETAGIGEVIGRMNTEQAETEVAGEPHQSISEAEDKNIQSGKKVMPSAARVLAQNKISAAQITGSGPGERILKEDALREAAKIPSTQVKKEQSLPHLQSTRGKDAEKERRVPMTLLRRTIAARLLEATQNMAMLTTFNEVDMAEVKKLRNDLGDEFSDKLGVRLGFMSFFVKTVVTGLLDFPLVNAGIDVNDIVYHDYCDIGVAIGGGKGLVVPVIRNAERLNFAEIERKIADFGQRAKSNGLSPDELRGGTFTISNGGVYGSMLSTPIVNPPQSAILGLHAIKDRPVVVDGEIRIRPIMYLALSYDHRVIDGREAVSFLKSVKERIEQPHKLLLEI